MDVRGDLFPFCGPEGVEERRMRFCREFFAHCHVFEERDCSLGIFIMQ